MSNNKRVFKLRMRILLAINERDGTSYGKDDLEKVAVRQNGTFELLDDMANITPPTREELRAVSTNTGKNAARDLWLEQVVLSGRFGTNPVVIAVLLGLIRELPGVSTRAQVRQKIVGYLSDAGRAGLMDDAADLTDESDIPE